ncbi:PepSY domain-containing protein [Massilia sp. BJB1822]|uniref:PepSY-associated TM helix domain-containing protein n=1 Tax=Massilia sp. BJB1822 TaxID=2744470 RepID=UPI001594C1CA|nr:PepSY-associated TM helix domain-containing protein [Massilia sp. BJB1822]NVD97289.1 PepSY domain-containing protein [Massilia sp. BJB1822]
MKIRSDILRIYQSLHTWAGLGAGMLLFIGFFAGALTMFKEPLDRWASRPATVHGAPAAATGEASLDKLVAQVLDQYPAARREFTLHLERNEYATSPVSWSAGEGGRELDLSARRWEAGLDASGQLQVRQALPTQLAQLIDMLHRTGGIPGSLGGEYLGIYLMGVAAVLYFLALVSGLILLLPTLVKDFFALRAGKNRKRFWLDAHNIVGITSLPFHIVISLTVIVFAFHDQFYDSLAHVVYEGRPMFGAAPGEKPVVRPLADMLPPTTLLRTVRDTAPGAEVTEVLFMGLDSPRPMVRAAVADARHLVAGPTTGFVMIDPYTGKTDTDMLPGKEDFWSSLVTPFFALHFGNYGGNLTRWIYFALGLGGAFLFYTGNLLWVEKRRKNQLRDGALPQQTRATALMASATLGVCLGSVAGAAFAIAAAKWLHAWVANANSACVTVYYAIFLASVAWAFWRGAARAAPQLLVLCALAAFAIPLATLAGWLLPQAGLWSHASGAALGVDLTGLVLGLVLLYGARLSARRLRHGPADSVWSAPQHAHAEELHKLARQE